MPVPYEILLGLALVCVAALGLMLLRQRTIATRVGTFVAQVRIGGERPHEAGAPPSQNLGFVPGTVQYAGDRIEFFRTFSLLPKPTYVWSRDDIEVISRGRAADLGGQEQYLVQCRFPGGPLDFLMTPAAYAGLTSWLEAAPARGPEGVF